MKLLSQSHRAAASCGLIICLFLSMSNGETASQTSTGTKRLNLHIKTRLKEQNIKPSKRSSDAEFFRRVRLDLTGQIPSVDQVLDFLRDGSKNKREKVIDALIGSELYLRHWTRHWMNWLVGRERSNANRRTKLENWVRHALALNTPYDRFVRDLVSSEGDVRVNGAGNYLLSYDLDPAELTSHVSRLFLGLPMQCAQCHDHKTETWYQEDFYGFAAFFAGTRRQAIYSEVDENELVSELIENTNVESIYIPGTDIHVVPRFLDGKSFQGPFSKRRHALAYWITDKDNPYFSKAIVNRIWAHFLGKAFVEPLDGFGEEYPPSDPELLDVLAQDFVIHGYDLQNLMRTILNSDAYQRTSETNQSNKSDDMYYSHAYIKPLDAEQFFYSMIEATGFERQQKLRDRGQLDEMKRFYLERFIFLLENGENTEIEAFNGTVPQALMMINGKVVNDAANVGQRGSLLVSILDRWRTMEDRLERIYLTALSRRPTAKEKVYFQRYLERSLYRKKELAYSDLYWALLNSAEFALNH